MKLREEFHKVARARGRLWPGVVVALLAISACADADAVPAGGAATPVAGSDATPALGADRAAPALPAAGYAWVVFGADTVLAEVAATADERAEGLMYRDAVPDGTGMLFVFEDSRPRAFWMANTYVALDIAYMDPSYRIVDIVAMEPLDMDTYPSRAPAMFALEVRQGWFAEHGITVGTQPTIVFGVQRR
jgi:uncharacterized membrane protein (UPF0127 family)